MSPFPDGFLIGKKFHCYTIDAISQIGRRRPIGENVSEMTAALAAVCFDLQIAVDRVFFCTHRAVDRGVKTRPAGIAFVFRFGDEQGLIAARAKEGARAFLIIERTAACRLGAKPAHDHVLLGS